MKMNDEVTITETVVYDVDKQNASFVAGEKPRSWTTWEGRRLTVEQIDHQHLSNIYWFNVLLYNRVYLFVVEELQKRFNGVLLPYRPDVRFDNEIRSLDKKGFLFEGGRLIQYNGVVIGEIKK